MTIYLVYQGTFLLGVWLSKAMAQKHLDECNKYGGEYPAYIKELLRPEITQEEWDKQKVIQPLVRDSGLSGELKELILLGYLSKENFLDIAAKITDLREDYQNLQRLFIADTTVKEPQFLCSCGKPSIGTINRVEKCSDCYARVAIKLTCKHSSISQENCKCSCCAGFKCLLCKSEEQK